MALYSWFKNKRSNGIISSDDELPSSAINKQRLQNNQPQWPVVKLNKSKNITLTIQKINL